MTRRENGDARQRQQPHQGQGDWHLGEADVALIVQHPVFKLFPVMRDATIMRAWAGIEARTADELPVPGPSARHDGLYHQFGFSLHGFQLGPAAGAVMAELIVNGGTQTRIGDLGIDRFFGGHLPARATVGVADLDGNALSRS